ncbi:PRC-barrel domain containing protein [Pseudotabrizicola sediminis]|uniref:PRC-barrel domain containing protein n=1 Tax=Pseudotabrizicola sediminis TaxID=2486418 RepID=A0ABY2KP36_9RHOB|nr:PRC-barrel domain-containing protein [Pseudotabrizicola sediminis]TGD43933.1 PRC-barrel domain containing protein [Pseudotabrizicola sediminis]
MDHSKHTPLNSTEYTNAILNDAPIYGADDEKIGTISHVHGVGTATDVVVDVGGFLGIGAKSVQLSLDQIKLMRDEAGVVHGVTTWTKEQIKDLPEHHD